jgi:acyl-CoA thioester hydrolase
MLPMIVKPLSNGHDGARRSATRSAAMTRTYRACFADTDATGFVYHARYFEMAERNHNELLLSLGVATADFARRSRDGGGNAALVLHSAAAKFASPAFLNDLLTIETEVQKHSAARSRWRTTISRDGSLICAIDAELVYISLLSGRAVLMPELMNGMIGRVAREWSDATANTPS